VAVRVGWDALSIHARAPLRIDFAGGWTDVPEYADREGGAVVAAGITLYAHVDVYLGGKKIKLVAEDVGERVTYLTGSQIRYDGRLDLHKAALKLLPVTGGIELLSRSDAPGGSGLGASGALDVALVAALALCRRDPYDKPSLAELGFMLEAKELGLLGGRQDQLTAALGGFQRYEFRSDLVKSRRVAVSSTAAEDLQRHVVIVYTGHSHFSSETHERVWNDYRRGDRIVVEALAEMRGLATNAAEHLEHGDWEALAETVNTNWKAQQRLHSTITTPHTEAIESSVRGAGAWGVKATGAGAGGCMLVLCPKKARPGVTEAARRAGGQILELEFAMEGVNVWERGDDVVK
jgi:D-glycero-alpha-D-manno-heptose-7-phosphate kinase